MGGTAADSDKVTFEPFGEGEGGRHLGFWRKSIAGREKSKCKNPEAGKSLLCSRNLMWELEKKACWGRAVQGEVREERRERTDCTGSWVLLLMLT